MLWMQRGIRKEERKRVWLSVARNGLSGRSGSGRCEVRWSVVEMRQTEGLVEYGMRGKEGGASERGRGSGEGEVV